MHGSRKWSESGGSGIGRVILVLIIIAALIAALYLWFPFWIRKPPQTAIHVNMDGALTPLYDGGGNWTGANITLVHRGGDRLIDARTSVVLTVQRGANTTDETLATRGSLGGVSYGIDGPDAIWDMGEAWKYTNYSIDETDRVSARVVDTISSLVLWNKSLAVTIGGTGCAASSSGLGGFLVDSNTYQVPSTPRPGLCQAIRDPVFGAIVTRVTDPSMGSAAGYRHEYTRLAAINADNTKAVVMRRSGGNYEILDLVNGTLVRTVPGVPCGWDPSIAWHRQDPDQLIFLCVNEVRTFRVSTGAVTTVMTFTGYTRVATAEEGTVSDDWSSVALFGHLANGSQEVIVADLNAKTIIARDASIAFGNWIGISPSGQYVVIQHGGTTGTRVYDRNLQYLRTLHPDFIHEDFAIDADGQELMVWYTMTAGQSAPFGGRSVIAKARLSDGQRTELIDTHWKWGGHLSGVGSRGRPGWILVSDYDAPGTPNDAPFQREIFWLKMDGSGEVRRLAHHHSDVAQCGASKDYWAEPHPVASWDGSRVLFASIWGDSCTRYDAFVIDSSWFA